MRTFPERFDLSTGLPGRARLASIIACNSDRAVTWINSYVSSDRRTVFCIYDAPSPEAVRLTARSNDLPVDLIIEVSVLDPYAYSVAESPQPRSPK